MNVFLGKADCSMEVFGPSRPSSHALFVFKVGRLEYAGRLWRARDWRFATRFVWGRRGARRLPAFIELLA